MALVPVEEDPFAEPAAPAAAPQATSGKLTPVDGDPFGPPTSSQAMQDRLARREAGRQNVARIYAGGQDVDRDVDYVDGGDFWDRVNLSKADNDRERMLYLTEKYGPAGWGRDSAGNFYVVKTTRDPDSGLGLSAPDRFKVQKTAIMGALPSDVTAQSTPIAGATAGARAGFGAAGIPGALAGALVGGAGGAAIDEITKMARGRHAKTPGETAQSVGIKGLEAGVGEGAGRLVGGVAGRLTKGPLPRFLSGTTPETEAVTGRLTDKGVAPPLASALPNSKIMQWHQDLSHRLGGPFATQDSAAQAEIERQLKDILRRGGVPENQIDDVFKEIADPKAAVSTRELGENMQTSLRAHQAALERNVEEELTSANQILEQQMQHIDALTRRYRPGDLGVNVSEGISTARKEFATAANKVYGRVDRLVGDEPLVPVRQMVRDAQRIVAQLPQSEARNIVHEIADLGHEVGPQGTITGFRTHISFSDAQRLRTRLRELADSPNLTPGAIKGDFARLENAVDIAFTQAAADPRAAPAVGMLRAADNFYKEGIKKFKNATINQLVKNTKDGLPPDPAVIADQIVQPGFAAQTRQIKKLLPAETWNRVMGQDWENMVRAATIRVDGREALDSGKLLREITKRERSDLMTVVYGPGRAGEIRQFAERLSALDGELPVANLTPDNFSQTLRFAQENQAIRDDWIKNNFLSSLVNEKKMPDPVLEFLVKPGEEKRLIQTIQHFGEGSEQVAALRQTALKVLMQEAIKNTESGVGRGVAGGGLEAALKGYTKEQQRLLFPNGLHDDLETVAKEAKFLFPRREEDMSAGLAAGTIKASMPWSAPVYGAAVFYGYIVSRPAVVRMLAIGLRGDGKARAAARETMMTVARAAALAGDPYDSGENFDPNEQEAASGDAR